MAEALVDIPGAAALIEWFGYWPSFHDAEVLEIRLCRTGESVIRLETFEMTSAIDSTGHYVLRKHVKVSFIPTGFTDVHLDGFSCQNVINGLEVIRSAEGYEIRLAECYGVAGSIFANQFRLEFEPGIPTQSGC